MTTKEELELLLQIMQKHDLPMSPILEYAIKEKLQGNTNTETSQMDLNEFNSSRKNISYAEMFRNLSTGVQNGKKLPHKAVLLFSILELVGNGTINNNKIDLSKTIASSFATTWDSFQLGPKIPSVWIPFWYMKSEPFWHFKALKDESMLSNLLSFAGHPTVGQMRNVIKCAFVDEQLFELMQDANERSALANALIETYLR
jgi:putative restriction endonuclease